MIKIIAITNDEREIEIENKKPRYYMTSWDFKRLLKYVEDELYWEEIKKDEVKTIMLYNKEEQWEYGVDRK